MSGVGGINPPTRCDFSLRNSRSICGLPPPSKASGGFLLWLAAVSGLISLFSIVEISRVLFIFSIIINSRCLIFFRPSVLVSSASLLFSYSGCCPNRVGKVVRGPLCFSFLYSVLSISSFRPYVSKVS